MITFKRYFITIAMVATLQTAWAQQVMLHLADNQVAEISMARLDSITFAAEGDSLMSSSVLNNYIFLQQGQKILLTGASFAAPNNGWDKLMQDMTGIEVITKAQGSTNIMTNVAARILDANSAKPHGSLFISSNRDVFDEVGAVIIFHSHNYDVLLPEKDYQSRSVAWYKSHKEEAAGENQHAGAFDYVIKQLKEWNPNIQILICSHWLPSRTTYNESSRMLALRHNVAYCALDKKLGFTADEFVRTITGIDGRTEPTEDNYNRSVLHSQFVAVTALGNPIGKTERIGGITWGWHPTTVNDSINYGCGTMTSRDGKTVYVPWIQKAIASTIAKSIIMTDKRDKDGNSRKFIQNKHLYIIRDGKTYSIDGKEIMKNEVMN